MKKKKKGRYGIYIFYSFLRSRKCLKVPNILLSFSLATAEVTKRKLRNQAAIFHLRTIDVLFKGLFCIHTLRMPTKWKKS